MARILIGNIKGPKGDTGAKGATGPQGPAGPQGPLPSLTNNALATTPGVSALDAVMGKTLNEKIGGVISDLVNDAVGYTAATTLYTADLANASGTIKIMVRNAIITIEIVSLTCTPDTPIYGIAGYVGSNKYFYDSDNTGLYIDKSQLYSKKANLGHVMWTFVIR